MSKLSIYFKCSFICTFKNYKVKGKSILLKKDEEILSLSETFESETFFNFGRCFSSLPE